jgi:type I restriction enzyme S subunit
MNFPITWQVLPLGELLAPQPNGRPLQQGWSPQCLPHPTRHANTWGVLKTSAIQAGYFDESQNKELPESLAPRPTLEVASGDILITSGGPRSRCGVPTIVRRIRPRLTLSDKMFRFRPAELIEPEFLQFWLLSPAAQRGLESMKTGSSDSGMRLAQAKFLSLPVPVPPTIGEQRRTVEFLESHLSRLDAGAAYAKSCLRRKESLRTSLLAENYIGQLTSLGQLSVKAGYGTSTKCEAGGPGVPVVRIPNLVGGSIDLSDEKRADDSDLNLSKYMLEPDDLLIVRTNGSVDLIGRAAVVQPGIEAAFASYLIRYRLNTAQVRPRWVSAMLSSPQVRTRLESLAASSAGQHNLSLGKLDTIELPVPTMDVQDSRLRRLDAIESDIARLTTACNQLLTREATLRMAILAAAFSGRFTSLRALSYTGIESA